MTRTRPKPNPNPNPDRPLTRPGGGAAVRSALDSLAAQHDVVMAPRARRLCAARGRRMGRGAAQGWHRGRARRRVVPHGPRFRHLAQPGCHDRLRRPRGGLAPLWGR
eukprot:scaffold6821_cov66-Phaeocystis_antarctica.AAC.3